MKAFSSERRVARVVWLLTLCTGLSLAGDATLYAVLPSHYQAIGLAALQVGWLLSVNRLARIPLNAVSGWLSNHLGFKGPYVAGMACAVLSTLAYGVIQDFRLLLALRVLWGAAWALLTVTAYGFILALASEQTRGRYTGIYSSFSFFIGGLLAILGGTLIDRLGWAAGMQWLGLLTLLGFGLSLALPSIRVGGVAKASAGLLSVRSWLTTLRFADRRLALLGLLNLAHRFFFAGIFYATFGRYLQMVLGDDVTVGGRVMGVASLTALLLFLRNVVSVVIGPTLGHLSDCLGNRVGLIALGYGLGATGLALLALARPGPTLVIAVLATAVAYGLVPPLLMAWLGDLTRGQRGVAIGGMQMMGDLGSGLGPLCAYALVETAGLPLSYGLSAVVLLICCLVGVGEAARRQRSGAKSQAPSRP